MTYFIRKHSAFTLAEVLITLAIIGIVAAMTIPTLVSHYEQQVLNKQFKKTYSMLNQALLQVKAQYGYIPNCYSGINGYQPPILSGAERIAVCNEFKENFLSVLKIAKYCKNKSYENGCIPEYKGVDTVANEQNPDAEIPEGYPTYGDYAARGCGGYKKDYIKNSASAYVLADSTIILPYFNNFDIIAVDINGKKGPNKWGYDIYTFTVGSDTKTYLYKNGGCMLTEDGGTSTANMINKIIHNEI